MFFWNKYKVELDFLRMRSNLQAGVIEDLADRLDRYEQILFKFNEHGFKKDGSPKAKPGRKKGLV